MRALEFKEVDLLEEKALRAYGIDFSSYTISNLNSKVVLRVIDRRREENIFTFDNIEEAKHKAEMLNKDDFMELKFTVKHWDLLEDEITFTEYKLFPGTYYGQLGEYYYVYEVDKNAVYVLSDDPEFFMTSDAWSFDEAQKAIVALIEQIQKNLQFDENLATIKRQLIERRNTE